jgi:Glycosyl transferase family 90
LLGSTEPSEFGRVVLLLNSDCLSMVRWNIRPPALVWVYSMPTSAIDPRMQNISDDPTVVQRCHLDGVLTVPTEYDTGTWNRFCVETVNRKMTKRTFADKINQVIWRGAIHSAMIEKSRVALVEYSRMISNDTATTDNDNSNNSQCWLNVRAVNTRDDPHHMELYELADYRYHLDLGGLSGTAWGGLRWKLCSGLLVFKVESWANDWWYRTLEPWTHYIPIRADVSDLHEKYQWTQRNPEAAQAIAEAGRNQCLKSFGPEVAQEFYRARVQTIPAADHALVSEADEILEQLIRLETDLGGLPSIAASTADMKYLG